MNARTFWRKWIVISSVSAVPYPVEWKWLKLWLGILTLKGCGLGPMQDTCWVFFMGRPARDIGDVSSRSRAETPILTAHGSCIWQLM